MPFPSLLFSSLLILDKMAWLDKYATIVLKRHRGTFRIKGPWFTNTSFIGLADPMNVDYITKKNVGNYVKGSKFHDIFEVLGVSIFNSDSDDVWKQEKTMFHLIL